MCYVWKAVGPARATAGPRGEHIRLHRRCRMGNDTRRSANSGKALSLFRSSDWGPGSAETLNESVERLRL